MLSPKRLAPVLLLSVLIIAAHLTACEDAPVEFADAPSDSVHVLAEFFETERDTLDNVDSPAVWHGLGDQNWVLTTAKETHVLLVHDGATGELLQRVGGEGAEPGMFRRPNGIATIDDLAIVVERDNKRVQIFRLPDFDVVGFFGEDRLKLPYGLAVVSNELDGYDIYVTDNYEGADEQIPPDSLLGDRVQHFRFTIENGSLSSEHVQSIGPTSGEGRLRVVESIFADAEYDRLLIAEEEDERSHIKVFAMSGEFTGEVIDRRYFPNEAEGIALYACNDGGGYWISTDQGKASNTFHIFDRQELEHVGSFAGETTMNTDGIALSQKGFGPFPSGAFYAVHDDQSIAAFSWEEIADALDLRKDCVDPDARGRSARGAATP